MALAAPPEGDAERGALLAGLARCHACHTAEDGERYAGGFGLQTPVGTFYGTNLTPHVEHGLGEWTQDDFVRAMRHGTSPNGTQYFPAFPYPSFTAMTDADLADLWAFLRTLAPVDRPNTRHDVPFPFNVRAGLRLWKLVELRRGPRPHHSEGDPKIARGAYLAEAVGHCGECHTARNVTLGLRRDRHMAGSQEPEKAPNITPHEDGIGGWSRMDAVDFLEMGMTPDGDFVGAGMRGIVRDGTSKLSDEDREALAAWMLALPPLPDDDENAGQGWWTPGNLVGRTGLVAGGSLGGVLVLTLGLGLLVRRRR